MQKKIIRIIVTLFFLAMALFGIARKEPLEVIINASTLCYSCIGLE